MKTSFLTVIAAALLAVGVGLCGTAQAQKVSGIKATPATIKPGEAAQIVVDLDVTDDRVNCGMRVFFGDGQQQDVKINQREDVPIKLSHTYANAGPVQVKAKPQNIGTTLGCLGKEVSTSIVVSAPVPAPAPVAAAAPVQTPPAKAAAAVAAPSGKAMAQATAPTCPEGFKLDPKSVNKKSGAYSCKGSKDAAMPAEKLICAGNLNYYENKGARRVGCRVE